MLAGSLTACNGSGYSPTLARADAQPLATLATRIAHEGPCAQRRDIQTLQRHALQLVSANRVPERLQAPLLTGVNALAADAPPCIPAVPKTTPPPPPPPHDHGHHHGHHGHGHGDKGD